MSLIKGAIIDKSSNYRYSLWRIWDEAKPLVVFIMLNPSTADAEEDDPTIKRCMNYARSWGYGGIKVVNLFAYRATDPRILKRIDNPVGPDNTKHIIKAAKDAGMVVAAWGEKGNVQSGRILIHKLIPELHYLELTKYGCPKHPLYLKADLKPQKWVL